MASKPLRNASITVELLFVLPVLLAMLLGTVEFSLWLAAQERVSLASREGARTAALGGSIDEVNSKVRLVLGEKRYESAEIFASLVDEYGEPLGPGDPVSVTIKVPATAVVPDLLRFIGLSIQNQFLISQTVMSKE